jgi:hypothetical protein
MREHLVAAWVKTGEMPEKLSKLPELDPEIRRLMIWYREAAVGRPAGMGAGPIPIPHAAWLAWMEYTGTSPSGMERLLLREIDEAFCRSHMPKKQLPGG